jgi:hypothetical protein
MSDFVSTQVQFFEFTSQEDLSHIINVLVKKAIPRKIQTPQRLVPSQTLRQYPNMPYQQPVTIIKALSRKIELFELKAFASQNLSKRYHCMLLTSIHL